jgi:hypothetical protein
MSRAITNVRTSLKRQQEEKLDFRMNMAVRSASLQTGRSLGESISWRLNRRLKRNPISWIVTDQWAKFEIGLGALEREDLIQHISDLIVKHIVPRLANAEANNE